jgi:hypothetical protein
MNFLIYKQLKLNYYGRKKENWTRQVLAIIGGLFSSAFLGLGAKWTMFYMVLLPVLGAEAFAGVHTSLSIKVPSSSVNAYKAATNWKNYASKISAI